MTGHEESPALEAEIAEVCGIINVATGRLVKLIARAVSTGAYEGFGIRSPEHWVAWKCGVSPARARQLVAMAKRLPVLPETRAALERGQLAEDQVAAVCRHAPAEADAAVALFARHATVSQLRRVLVDYAWEERATPDAQPEERRWVTFGHRDDGYWRLSALLPADEGALVERALTAARKSLLDEAESPKARDEITWSDALVEVANRALSPGGTGQPHHLRHTVLVHLDTAKHAHLHLGPGLPDSLRRHLGCDGRVRAVLHAEGSAVSVGRSQRIVPERTRMVVEERDRGCRVPGCPRTRWLEIHHLMHWEDGGATDTANLVALCGTHHRLHHRGKFEMSGDPETPDGLVFTDERGRRLTGSGRPAPPGDTADATPGDWAHPSGERLDGRLIYFDESGPRAEARDDEVA